MTTVEILKAARAKIANPSHWGQGSDGPALYGAGAGTCAYLAITWTRGEDGMDRYVGEPMGALHALARVMGGEGNQAIFRFNDSRTHAEVLAAFDQAIANEEAREAEFDVPDEFVQAVKEIVNV